MAPGPYATTAAPPHSSEAKRACVLVAEDEDRLRELTIDVLEAHGFEAIAARHGGEALSLFAERADHIDAVLLDLSMPVVDGAHVLGEMRRQKPSVRVVLTSGFDEQHASIDAETGGSISFLPKPYRAESLLRQLRAVLAAN